MFMLDFAVIGALIMGLTQVLKLSRLAGKRGRFAPVIALIIGVALSCANEGLSLESVIGGLIVALTAMGLYGGTKKIIKG